ncbi:hypothetical protein B0I35DRAFT_415058 [Stachybotrys elegans]|uniref:Uncharacterized protein n=1 Tax=Stachybotrys elegans TaxID=80388 RepID=A0A8K0SHE5_9HYPO|nr:hypothetical protein B0I35DRAFT_415058 [Stachybotrys elegans]
MYMPMAFLEFGHPSPWQCQHKGLVQKLVYAFRVAAMFRKDSQRLECRRINACKHIRIVAAEAVPPSLGGLRRNTRLFLDTLASKIIGRSLGYGDVATPNCPMEASQLMIVNTISLTSSYETLPHVELDHQGLQGQVAVAVWKFVDHQLENIDKADAHFPGTSSFDSYINGENSRS